MLPPSAVRKAFSSRRRLRLPLCAMFRRCGLIFVLNRMFPRRRKQIKMRRRKREMLPFRRILTRIDRRNYSTKPLRRPINKGFWRFITATSDCRRNFVSICIRRTENCSERITYDGMAVHFPDTIVWSPDSKTIAFVGMIRAGQPGGQPLPTPIPAENQTNTATNSRGKHEY